MFFSDGRDCVGLQQVNACPALDPASEQLLDLLWPGAVDEGVEERREESVEESCADADVSGQHQGRNEEARIDDETGDVVDEDD